MSEIVSDIAEFLFWRRLSLPIQRGGLVLAVLLLIVQPSSGLITLQAAGDQDLKTMLQDARQESRLLKRIAGAHSKNELTMPCKHPPKSKIGQMILAAAIYHFDAGQGASEVLRAAPKSDVEMEAFNEFAHQRGNEAFRKFYRAFYGAVFDSVIRKPRYLHLAFMIAVEFNTKNWPDYDDIDWYCAQLARVHNKIPKQYDRAIMKEQGINQRFLRECGSGH